MHSPSGCSRFLHALHVVGGLIPAVLVLRKGIQGRYGPLNYRGLLPRAILALLRYRLGDNAHHDVRAHIRLGHSSRLA